MLTILFLPSCHAAKAAKKPAQPTLHTIRSENARQKKSGQPESYGRSLLSEKLRSSYDILKNAAFQGQKRIVLPLLSGDELKRLLTYIQRDYPELYLLKSDFTYLCNQTTDTTIVNLSYREDPLALSSQKKIKAAAAKLLANISPALSDFDKAVIVHDRLMEQTSYQLNTGTSDLLYGALCNKQAGCNGYAKAYQYLLRQLGIQALIVYGKAGNGPHAWNIVRLDGEYYEADVTWDDSRLPDNTPFPSHEYLFLSDRYFYKTHVPNSDGSNYPLPACSSMKDNYFVKYDLVLTSDDETAAEKKLKRAFDLASSNRSTAVQVFCSTAAIGRSLEKRCQSGNGTDSFFQQEANKKGAKTIGRALSNDKFVLTYLIKYQ